MAAGFVESLNITAVVCLAAATGIYYAAVLTEIGFSRPPFKLSSRNKVLSGLRLACSLAAWGSSVA